MKRGSPIVLSGNNQRRLLLLHVAGLLIIGSLFIGVSHWLDTRLQQRGEAIFNEQQSLHTLIASKAIRERFSSIFELLGILAFHSTPELLSGGYSKESYIDLLEVTQSHMEPMAYLGFAGSKAKVEYESSLASPVFRKIGVQWIEEYWEQLQKMQGSITTPPMLTDAVQSMAILCPVRHEGRFLGALVAVVDLSIVMDNYVRPIRSGEHGAAYVVDAEGNVVFDHEPGVIGRNVFTQLHVDYPDALRMDERLVTEDSGTDAYRFMLNRSEEKTVRKLVAWHSVHVGSQKFVIALSAPDIDADEDTTVIRMERIGSGIILFLLLAALFTVSYRTYSKRELLAANERLSDILEFLPDPTFVVDSDGIILAWNRAMAQMTNVAPEEMIGKGNKEYSIPLYGNRCSSLIDLVFDDSEKELERRYHSIDSSGGLLNAETFVPGVFGGEGAHVWATASRLYDREGNVVGAIESIRDITDRIETQQDLHASRERYALAVRGANDGIWDWDVTTDTVYFSPRWKEIIGYEDRELGNSVDEWIGRIHPEDHERVMAANMSVPQGKADHFEVEYRLRHKDGSYRWVLGRGAGLHDEQGRIYRMAGAHTDITERKKSETTSAIMLGISSAVSATNDLSELYSHVHELLASHMGAETMFIALVDPDRDLINFVYARDPDHGLPWDPVRISDIKGSSMTLHVYETGVPAILDRRQMQEIGFFGNPPAIWMGVPLKIKGNTIGVMAMHDYNDPERYTQEHLQLLSSVSEQLALAIERKRNEEKLTHQALHDSLTGLPNRTLFLERLERVLTRARERNAGRFSVLMLDLDRFKIINDSHGHLIGDEVLRTIARRLTPVVRSVDTLARLGGDEFAVLLEEVEKPGQVMHIVRRIQDEIARPIEIDGIRANTSASVGIVLRTKPYKDPGDMLRDADIAMYQAKNSGQGLFRVFNKAMHQQAMETMQLENDLVRALENNEFELHYQPQFDVITDEVLGFEALVRWNHPERGLVSPIDFIPVAEETGLIIPIGQWVMREAARTLRQWNDSTRNGTKLSVAVNVSARQASQAILVSQTRRVLRETGIEPCQLKLEITETAIMNNPEESQDILARINALGVEIAIDDFGTGYSSLSHLSRFPVDILKIDHSFVCDLTSSQENREIVRAIIALANIMGLSVIAEGVEDQGQFEEICDMQCHAVQGYFLSHPLDRESAEEFMRKRNILS